MTNQWLVRPLLEMCQPEALGADVAGGERNVTYLTIFLHHWLMDLGRTAEQIVSTNFSVGVSCGRDGMV